MQYLYDLIYAQNEDRAPAKVDMAEANEASAASHELPMLVPETDDEDELLGEKENQGSPNNANADTAETPELVDYLDDEDDIPDGRVSEDCEVESKGTAQKAKPQ